MLLSNDEVRALYRKTAPFYDAILAGYRLLGVKHHRRDTVAALRLAPEDTGRTSGSSNAMSTSTGTRQTRAVWWRHSLFSRILYGLTPADPLSVAGGTPLVQCEPMGE